jgi:glycosyltransferase involved in cell wall biosynthesis
MKICMVRTSPNVIHGDSYNIQELGLAKGLLKYNVLADILMSSGSLRTYKVEKYDGVTIYKLPCCKLPGEQGLFTNIFSFLSRHKYDLIQVHDDIQLYSCLVARWAYNRNIPVVLYNGVYQKYSGLLPAIYDLTAFKLLSKSVSVSICKTPFAKLYLEKKGFNKKVIVLPVGLDIDKFNEPIMVDWIDELGLDENIDKLLYIGNIERRRNIPFLIEVFNELLKEVKAYLIIAGDGPDVSLCKKMVNEFQMDKYIRFVGIVPQDKITSLYKISSLFLLPSTYEIYGMVVLESMYFGVPVISTATPGPMSIITSDKDGIIMPNINVVDWKNKILYLLRNSQVREAYGISAKEKIEKLLTWPTVAEKYSDVFRKIINDKKISRISSAD